MAASKMEVNVYQQEGGALVFEIVFPAGEKRSFTLTPDSELYVNFAAQGFIKKVRDQIVGKVDSPEAIVQVDKLLNAFHEGHWNVSRNNEGGSSLGLLAQALVRLYKCTEDYAKEYVGKLNKKQQADLRAEPTVAAEIVQIRAEKAKEGDAPNALLADFTSSLAPAPAAEETADM